MIKKHIATNRGNVYYWISENHNKNAKCLVFTHGLSANHTMFDHQIEYFKKDYNIITWDIPLHGLSRPYNNFSYKNSSDDLNSILKNENIQKIIPIGMSMGGYLCQEFCKEYPQKVLAFIALDTTPLSSNYYSKFDIWLLGKLLAFSKTLNDKRLRHSIANIISTSKNFTKQEIINLMNFAYKEFSIGSEPIEFAIPVLILLGENDKTRKVKKFCKLWAEKENHKLCYIENASHFSHADNEVQVNSEIDRKSVV